MIKIGLVGTGYFSTFHGEILEQMEDVQITAICGTSEEKAAGMTAKFTNATGYNQLTEMLDAEQLDGVYICVPPMMHGEIELALIERGIPFLVEKPLGNDLEIPSMILKKIQEKNLLTSVGYQFRYSESIKALKHEVSHKNIGMALGQWMGSMPGVAWWRDQEKSGGQFLEQTTHIVDLLRYIGGEVEEVYALFGHQVLAEKDPSVTVADVGTITLKLKNGIVANISNTCILPNGVGENGLSFYTDEGLLDWKPGRLLNVGSQTEVLDQRNPYEVESEAFIHAIRTGDQSKILADYEDSFKTHLVTCAALESAKTNQPVKLSYDNVGRDY